jgi:uncharacterized RDD family membrane protein YckC
MDCWEVLGIERFADKKSIKIAYAKQLKLHRPDEDPEGFKNLHRAYKSALSWIPSGVFDDSSRLMPSPEVTFEDSEDTLDNELTEAVIDSLMRSTENSNRHDIIDPSDQELLDEIRDQEYLISEDWQNLYQKVGQIIKSESSCNDLKQWKFLESLASMNDLEFRKAAGDQVFDVVAEVNTLSLESSHLHIKRPVINYLNELFSWDKKWQEYQLVHSRKTLNSIYPYLEEADKPVKGINKKRELYYYRRGTAFAIDLAIFSIPILVFVLLKGFLAELGFIDILFSESFSGDQLVGLWILLYFLLIIPLQESSKFQATIGKYLLGLQVISSQGDRIGILRSFWRSLVTIVCCVAFKVVVFINIILSYWRSEILQDTLSRSYVIMRPGYL